MGTPQSDNEGGQAQRIDLFKMIDQSRHRSVETLRGYVRDAEMFEEHAGRRGCFEPRSARTSQSPRCFQCLWSGFGS